MFGPIEIILCLKRPNPTLFSLVRKPPYTFKIFKIKCLTLIFKTKDILSLVGLKNGFVGFLKLVESSN